MKMQPAPVFWRDPRMPHVELRTVADGRQVRYAPHSHTQWSLGAITEGQSTFVYRNDEYVVSAGDLVLMNPEWVHTCNPIDNQPWAYVMMYVDTQWLTDLRYQGGLLQRPVWEDISTAVITSGAWYARYCRMAECLEDSNPSLLDKQSKLVEFLTELMQELVGEISGPPIPDALKDLVAYLDDNAGADMSLEELCSYSGYSASHLIRTFKQHFNLTPHAYLINRRIQRGRLDLQSGVPIVEAALNAGFADQAHFQRTFKRVMAATPNQYRRLSR